MFPSVNHNQHHFLTRNRLSPQPTAHHVTNIMSQTLFDCPPGQFSVPQDSSSTFVLLPEHVTPPHDVAGLLQVRWYVTLRVPPPHVTEQVLESCSSQSDQPPLTGYRRKQTKVTESRKITLVVGNSRKGSNTHGEKHGHDTHLNNTRTYYCC